MKKEPPQKQKDDCRHTSLSKEYLGGMDTGDYVCDHCGKSGYGKGWPQEERKRSQK